MTRSTVLLLGRTPFDRDATSRSVDPALDVALLTGTGLDDVREAFSKHEIDIVIMGAGLDQETRIEVVRHVTSVSPKTTIHLKDRDSGREGMMPFVNGVLTGLTWHQWTWAESDEASSALPGPAPSPGAPGRGGGNLFYRMWKYLFGRSEPPEHPPPPPYSPGAGI